MTDKKMQAIENLRAAVENFPFADDMGDSLYKASLEAVGSIEAGTPGLWKLRKAIGRFEDMADDGEAMFEAAEELLENL